MTHKNILIVCPALNAIEPRTAKCIVDLCCYTLTKTKHSIHFDTFSSSILAGVRNIFAHSAIDNGFTHLFTIDADMDFPPQVLAQMLKAGKDIVAANCVTKSETNSVFTATGFDGKKIVTDWDKEGLEQVVLAGTGLMLIDLKILKDIPEPWFLQPWQKENKRIIGEDYYFTHKAVDHGFEVFIDHDVSRQVLHIGKKPYSINDALINIRQNGILTENSTNGDNSEA